VRIADIEAIPVEIDVKRLGDGWGVAPYRTGIGTTEETRRLLIRVETDGGVTGWGETTPAPSVAVAKTFVEDVIEPDLVGRSVHEVELIGGGTVNGGNREDVYDYGYMNFDAYRGGVDMAMWDAFGKQLDAPLYELLGGRTASRVPVAFCLAIVDVDDAVEHARRAYDHGFSVLKTKGGRDWRADVERLRAMHDATDGRLDIRIDPNQSLGFEDAVRLGAALEDEGVYVQYFEQPVRAETFGTYKRLRERLRQPVAVNEDMYFAHNLTHLVREDAVDCVVIDLVPAGGMLAAKRLAGIANDAGVSVAHHSSFDLGIKTAAVLHLQASTPAINLPPDRVNYALEDDVIEDRFELDEGHFAVPDGAGLGVAVDEGKVEEHRLD
jgi:L-alanine-DL-glutamate epimerase-like enolase superfamily enzyme